MRHPADKIARIAAVQHGRITTQQLRALSLDKYDVRRWVAAGRLHREHAGVFAVGHPGRTDLADYMSAVLAAGAGAALSHASAAHLLRLLPRRPTGDPHVTVPTLAGRHRSGIRIHRVARLHLLDVSEHLGIAVTTVPRVLLDLAPSTAPPQLTRACHEAWVHHRAGLDRIEACIARNPHKPGAGKLRHALGTDVLLSELERRFVALLHSHDLPIPRTNIDHRGDKIDCHWPDRNLTIELHSWRYHGTRHAFETDLARRRRSNHVPFSYGDVVEKPHQTIAELRTLLSATG